VAYRIYLRNRFPFVIKPIQTSEEPLHIESLMNEPRAYINASSANCWIYRDRSNITRFLVAGHGNAPVCKRVSSLIFTTYLNLKDIDEVLMVPGACLLKVGALSSGFNSLKELEGETKRLQEESGLVSIREAKEIDYQKMQNRILNWMEEYLKNKNDTLLCHEKNGGQSNAIFLPFYTLNANKPKILSFELNINLFADEDYDYLCEFHRHSIILEMTSDACRRKRIYEEWSRIDQERYNIFGLKYKKMSSEERFAKSITITNVRNYLEATTSRSEKEICISPKEMYESNLPSLINEDKKWIRKMEQLIKDLKGRDKEREKRIDSINIATLIDSFLRGWPSIFLQEEEAKQRYEKWCDNKRKGVWEVIHKELRRQGIRIDPLLVENTVFQIRNINNERLLVSPLHLIDSNEFLILLSKKYGLTYYVNLWEHRKLIFAEKTPGESNQEKSNYFYNAGVHVLMNNNRSKALELFKRALQFHPVYAFSEIFEGWWQQFSRDTSEDFTIECKDLFRGITAFYTRDYQKSIEYLKSFVEKYPDYLADPYIMISFQENQMRRGFFQKIEKHQELINKYEKVRESYIIRREVLESYRKQYGATQFEELIRFSNELLYGTSQFEEIKRVSNELIIFQEQLKSLESSIKNIRIEIEQILKEIWHNLKNKEVCLFSIDAEFEDDLNKGIISEELKDKLKTEGFPIYENVVVTKEKDDKWVITYGEKIYTVKKEDGKLNIYKEDLYIKKSLELDFNYVNKILNQEKIELSDTYWMKFRPLHDMLKGDEFIHIAEVLSRLSYDLKDIGGALFEIKSQVDKCLEVEYLQGEDLTSLREFKKKIDSFSEMDSITRELIFRNNMNEIAQDYFQKGLNLYHDSLRFLPQFVEPFKKLIHINSMFRAQYRKALEAMTSTKISLRNFSPQGTFEVLDKSNYNVIAVRIDRSKNLMKIKDDDGNEISLIRFSNLSDIEIAHLEGLV